MKLMLLKKKINERQIEKKSFKNNGLVKILTFLELDFVC